MIFEQRTVTAVFQDERLVDVRIEQAGKIRHMFGRGAQAQERALSDKAVACQGLIVFLGSGLGLAIQTVVESTDVPILIVDCEADILECTGVKQKIAQEERVVWLSSNEYDARAVAACIFDFASKQGVDSIHCLAHPAYFRLHTDFYKGLNALLEQYGSDVPSARASFGSDTPLPNEKSQLFDRLRRPRFTTWPPRVLLLTSKLFLMGEVVAAFDRLGVPYTYVDIGADVVDADEFVSLLLSHVDAFRPDFILTVNHLGVDREGILAELLRRLDIPLASWFVDNPELMLALYADPVPPNCAVFTWDADNVVMLKQMGFPLVEYLPLAVDEKRFHPGVQLPHNHPWRTRVSFVGNSMVTKTQLRLQRAALDPNLTAFAPTLAQLFCQHGSTSVRSFLESEYPQVAEQCHALGDAERCLAFETYIAWEATRLYRRQCIEQLLPFQPLIIGDPGWLETFEGQGTSWHWHKEVSYYDELPLLYPHAAINFNATSMQMKGAVNQRVFDVPAAQAFLITDHRRQLEDLFEPGREVVVYHTPEEIPELVKYYLDHPTERRHRAEAGHQRVLAEHTYTKRLTTLLRVMRAGFGL